MNVKEYMSQLAAARLKCADLRSRIADLDTRCRNTTAKITGTPGGGTSGSGDGLLALLADEKTRLIAALTQEVLLSQEIDEFISSVDTPEPGKTMLKRRYLLCESITTTQRWLDRNGLPYSRAQLYRLYSAAMRDAEGAYLNKSHSEVINT